MNILERIKKLLRLAQNAGSEQEAALAAQRARQLMAQHEIHEASINLDGPDERRAVEEIVQCHPVTFTKKRVAWHLRIASAVAASYGAECYTNGGYSGAEENGIRFFGRLSAVQAAAYTTQYLIRKVEEITDAQAPSELYARRYHNAFRLGCASRISARINEEAQAERQKLAKRRQQAEQFEATVATRAKREQFDVSDEGGELPDLDKIPTPPASAGVLARVEKDREEVHTAYKAYSKKWGRSTGIGTVSSGSGYDAGKAAGDRVKLGNRARGGLPRGCREPVLQPQPAGSPAMVYDNATAARLAKSEKEFYEDALTGIMGVALKERAEREGLKGIVERVLREQRQNRRNGFVVRDLITHEEYWRPQRMSDGSNVEPDCLYEEDHRLDPDTFRFVRGENNTVMIAGTCFHCKRVGHTQPFNVEFGKL